MNPLQQSRKKMNTAPPLDPSHALQAAAVSAVDPDGVVVLMPTPFIRRTSSRLSCEAAVMTRMSGLKLLKLSVLEQRAKVEQGIKKKGLIHDESRHTRQNDYLGVGS